MPDRSSDAKDLDWEVIFTGVWVPMVLHEFALVFGRHAWFLAGSDERLRQYYFQRAPWLHFAAGPRLTDATELDIAEGARILLQC
jgi:hypothetical protein